MKLNLLPQTEKKSRQGKSAIILATLIVLGSIAGYGALTLLPTFALNQAKSGIDTLERQVADADAKSKSADVIIAQAAPILRNAQLAKAMIDHNDAYPKLYNDIKRYIPPYYRIQTISASPVSDTQSQLVLTGTLTGYQKYADLMLALMRFKDATSISREGYNLNDPVVPALDLTDQKGTMKRAGEAPVPEDGLERLAYFQAKAAAAPSGYQSLGYGSGTDEVRGPLPDASVVTIRMTVSRDLRVPLAAETLRSGGGGAAAPAFGGRPGGPGGPPSGFGPPGGQLGPAGPPGSGPGGR